MTTVVVPANKYTEEPSYEFTLPEHPGLPDRDFIYGPSIMWSGGEEKFGKWRMYHNMYESDWMLTYNVRYDSENNDWGPRDSGNSLANIAALMRFDVAEGISGRNVFEIKFEKSVDGRGTVTSSTANTITDTTKSWTGNEAQNHDLFLLDDDEKVIEKIEISSNTSNKITVTSNFLTGIPDTGVKYSIGVHSGWITGAHYIFYDGCPTYMRGAPAEFKIAAPGGLDSVLKLSSSETASGVKLNLKNYHDDKRFRIEQVHSISLSPSFSETVTKYLTLMLDDDGGSLEGYFGINEDNPSYFLDVDGDIRVQHTLRFGDGSSMITASVGAGGTATSVVNTTDIVINADSDNNASGDLDVQIGGSSRFSIPNSTASSARLHGQDFRLDNVQALVFRNTEDTEDRRMIYVDSANHAHFASGLWSDLRFYASEVEAMRIWNTTGYVSINKLTAPTGQFEVVQDEVAGAIPVLVLDQQDVSEGVIDFLASARGAITGGTNSTQSVRVELNGTIYRLALFADA